MEWIKKESSFKYDSTPVIRTKYYCNTPLGQFKVYEAVGGKIFYEALRKTDWVEIQRVSFQSYRMSCNSLEEGKQICEHVWEEIKKEVNKT